MSKKLCPICYIQLETSATSCPCGWNAQNNPVFERLKKHIRPYNSCQNCETLRAELVRKDEEIKALDELRNGLEIALSVAQTYIAADSSYWERRIGPISFEKKHIKPARAWLAELRK